MAITKSGAFGFVPQVEADRIMAYFKKKLIWGGLAWKVMRDFSQTQGETITFPYWKQIGPVEDADEDTELKVDSLGDASFAAVVKEIGKAVGITDKSKVVMGSTPAEWSDEAHRQLGRVFAEKVDVDLRNEIAKPAAHKVARTLDTSFSTTDTASQGASLPLIQSERLDIKKLWVACTDAFGDRRDEIEAIVMHSQQYADIGVDSEAGFLKADANDPLFTMKGFRGRDFFGTAWIINDNVPPASDVVVSGSSSSEATYKAFNVVLLKPKAYGFIVKKDAMVEYARNPLARTDFISSTQWYAVRHFHNVLQGARNQDDLSDTTEISQEDERIAFVPFATKLSA